MSQESAAAEIKIGQPVVIGTFSGWNDNYDFGYKVIRVTKTGQVVVSDEHGGPVRRFDNRLKEIGAGRYSTATLLLNIEELQQKVENERKLVAAETAIAAVSVTMRNYRDLSKEALQALVIELETKLAFAKEKLALCASESQEQLTNERWRSGSMSNVPEVQAHIGDLERYHAALRNHMEQK